ncbi:uncharacterized protein LOC135717547 isoform X2 [Ochlerotatus camptorhynchus]|uniref:uncharacterized protein LOC135717547 isoform X2 n=1 Tax=Ochlerotatus camptorhynchus TaxID=644619 RepID=UPI0031D8C6E4
MEPIVTGSFIDASKDYIYTGSDGKCFPVCCTCGEYSPFMIYLGSNEKSIMFQPHAGRTQLFCPVCAPDSDHFRKHFHGEQLFRADSILNDRKFLDLLNRYVYSNPYYELYSNVDRIIITENTQLCAAYKTVARRKVPKSFKMKLLMNLFPAAHRLPNKKYTSTGDLYESMNEKYNEICVSYMNLSEAGGSQLLDNFDILIDRTPMGERQVSRKTVPFRAMKSNNEPMVANLTGNSLASDMLDDSDKEIRAVSDSDDERSSIVSGGTNRHTDGSSGSGSNITIASEFQVSSGEVAGDHSIVPSSQSQPSQLTELHSSVNISSQSVAQSVAAEITIGDFSDSDDSGTAIYFQQPRAVRRQSPKAADDQQAGPSNVKRRRVRPRGHVRPMNPTPQEALENPIGRLPRLDGG